MKKFIVEVTPEVFEEYSHLFQHRMACGDTYEIVDKEEWETYLQLRVQLELLVKLLKQLNVNG